jgi:hypothetical protein
MQVLSNTRILFLLHLSSILLAHRFAWRLTAQHSPLLHFAVSLDPTAVLHCIVADIIFVIMTVLNKNVSIWKTPKKFSVRLPSEGK